MILEPIKIITKNNQEIIFRSPSTDEAQSILDAMVEIAKSSPYILSTPENFKARTLESQVKWIEGENNSDSAIVIGVYFQNKIVGFCKASVATQITILFNLVKRPIARTLIKQIKNPVSI